MNPWHVRSFHCFITIWRYVIIQFSFHFPSSSNFSSRIPLSIGLCAPPPMAPLQPNAGFAPGIVSQRIVLSPSTCAQKCRSVKEKCYEILQISWQEPLVDLRPILLDITRYKLHLRSGFEVIRLPNTKTVTPCFKIYKITGSVGCLLQHVTTDRLTQFPCKTC